MITDRELLIEHLEDEVATLQLKCDWSGIELLEEAKKSAIRDTNGRLSICSLTVGAFETGILRDNYGAEIDYLEVPDILAVYGVLWKNKDGQFNPKITKTAKEVLWNSEQKAAARKSKLITGDHIFEVIRNKDYPGSDLSRIQLLRSLGAVRRWDFLDATAEDYLRKQQTKAYPMGIRN